MMRSLVSLSTSAEALGVDVFVSVRIVSAAPRGVTCSLSRSCSLCVSLVCPWLGCHRATVLLSVTRVGTAVLVTVDVSSAFVRVCVVAAVYRTRWGWSRSLWSIALAAVLGRLSITVSRLVWLWGFELAVSFCICLILRPLGQNRLSCLLVPCAVPSCHSRRRSA